jgi:hypothetical protein
LFIWTAFHLIRKPYSPFNIPPPPWHFLNSSFPSLHLLVFPSPASSAFDLFFPNTDPHPLMPPKPGPWALEGVKRRLRQEQVARERAASERYRQREERDNLREITPLEERNAGGRGSSNCYLFVLVLICFILSLSVLVLCGTVLSLLKKDNER